MLLEAKKIQEEIQKHEDSIAVLKEKLKEFTPTFIKFEIDKSHVDDKYADTVFSLTQIEIGPAHVQDVVDAIKKFDISEGENG